LIQKIPFKAFSDIRPSISSNVPYKFIKGIKSSNSDYLGYDDRFRYSYVNMTYTDYDLDLTKLKEYFNVIEKIKKLEETKKEKKGVPQENEIEESKEILSDDYDIHPLRIKYGLLSDWLITDW